MVFFTNSKNDLICVDFLLTSCCESGTIWEEHTFMWWISMQSNFIIQNFHKTFKCTFLVSLRKICGDYHKRICELEDAKYDLDYAVAVKDLEASKASHLNLLMLYLNCLIVDVLNQIVSMSLFLSLYDMYMYILKSFGVVEILIIFFLFC